MLQTRGGRTRVTRAIPAPPSGAHDATDAEPQRACHGLGTSALCASPQRGHERHPHRVPQRADCVHAVVAEWLAERGIAVTRSTVYRWVQRLLPSLQVAARRHRQLVGGKWRVDETYCRLSGRWAYCYRAIDAHGQVVDVLFSDRRNTEAARRFFERAIDRSRVEPARVTTDRAGAYPPVLRQVLPAAEHRRSKYLNNALERDHQHLKQRLRPMRGFKRLRSADTVTCGHALVQHLRTGFSALTVAVPRQLRLAAAWPERLRVI